MIFFHKKKDQGVETVQEVPSVKTETQTAIHKETEVRTALARPTGFMDEGMLHRTQDRLRLFQTKLGNLNQTLEGLETQKTWYHTLKELKVTFEKHKTAYFESNKQYNSRLKEIKELERFETFGTVLDDFLRIRTKEEMLHTKRQEMSDFGLRIEKLTAAYKEAAKVFETDEKKYTEQRGLLKQMRKKFAEGYQLQTEIIVYEKELMELSKHKAAVEQDLASLSVQAEQLQSEIQKLQDMMSEKQLQQQNLESQQRMLEKGEVIQTKLNVLLHLKGRKEQKHADLETAIKKQQEQNEHLNQLFMQYQELNAQTETLQSELHVHQKSILGMDSYKLQQRAMDLKSKREQLENASQLWEQISQGYAMVDEKSQELMRMRHQLEAMKYQIGMLKPEVTGLRTQCEELNYAYTLSKSRDIMQLRKDLKEGSNCSVCGATHHPFHSDTLLEQSKLIGELKTDYEQAATTLKNKEAQLYELEAQQVREEGRIDLALQTLELLKSLLHGNVQQWSRYSALDRTFSECSPSTNMEGRRIMLHQLLEKVGLDAEQAQKELDSFNFHQTNINNINEKISRKEQEKKDLSVRLNEVNTGCQVLAYRTEQLQHSYSRVNTQYSEMQEEIDRMMALSNWYKVWNENADTLRIYLQEQTRKWETVNQEMATLQQEFRQQSALKEALTAFITSQTAVCNAVNDRIGQISELKMHRKEQLQKVAANGDVEALHRSYSENATEAEQQKEASRQLLTNIADEKQLLQGHYDELTEQIKVMEEQIASERSKLDFWIKRYNTTHSPVQVSELEEIFSKETEWNVLRKEVRELTLNNLVAEARMEESKMAIAAHQISAQYHNSNEQEDRTTAINTEIARLKDEREQILIQIVQLKSLLQEHENAMQRKAAEQQDISI